MKKGSNGPNDFPPSIDFLSHFKWIEPSALVAPRPQRSFGTVRCLPWLCFINVWSWVPCGSATPRTEAGHPRARRTLFRLTFPMDSEKRFARGGLLASACVCAEEIHWTRLLEGRKWSLRRFTNFVGLSFLLRYRSDETRDEASGVPVCFSSGRHIQTAHRKKIPFGSSVAINRYTRVGFLFLTGVNTN